MNSTIGIRKGECECCDANDVDTYLMHGNTWMCVNCRQNEYEVMKKQSAQPIASTPIINESHPVTYDIRIKPDIYNAQTKAFVDIRMEIDKDDSIPTSEKNYAYATRCREIREHLDKVIFEKNNELLELRNQLSVAQRETQAAVGRLHVDKREEFKKFDVTYEPTTKIKVVKAIKSIKTTKSLKPKLNMDELREASKSSGFTQQLIQSVCVSKNLSPLAAVEMIKSMM